MPCPRRRRLSRQDWGVLLLAGKLCLLSSLHGAFHLILLLGFLFLFFFGLAGRPSCLVSDLIMPLELELVWVTSSAPLSGLSCEINV